LAAWLYVKMRENSLADAYILRCFSSRSVLNTRRHNDSR
jgi:hypothetical protein